MKGLRILLLTFFIGLSYGQAPKGKLFVLNEGGGNQKGSFGYVDFQTKTYHHIDSIASYGNVLVKDPVRNYIYITDGVGDILVYDVSAGQITDTIAGASARQVAVWNNQLLVTAMSKPFFRVYDISNAFAPIYSLDTTKVRSRSEGILVANNNAYVVMQGSWGSYDSLVAIIDLNAQDTAGFIQVKPNPGNILHIGNKLYVQCRNYTTGLTISIIDLANNNQVTNVATGYVSGGGFENVKDSLILFNYNPTWTTSYVASYDITSGVIDTNYINAKVYAMHYFDSTQTLFVSITDYVTFGSVSYYQGGVFGDTINTHLSPRDLLFVPAQPTAVSFVENESLKVYPSPSYGELHISSENPFRKVEIFDLQGRSVFVDNHINTSRYHTNLSSLKPGMYFLKITQGNSVRVIKWLKR